MEKMILLLGSFGNLLVEASLDPCSPCKAQYPADPSRDQNVCDCEGMGLGIKDLKKMANPKDWSSHKVLDLYFGTNKLGCIEKDYFTGFVDSQERSIRTLSLPYNDIESIESGSFDKLIHLQILDLSKNKIQTLPENLFEQNMQTLERIDLTNNRIHSLPAGLFRQLNVLTSLRLSHNFLTQLDAQAFKYTSSLHALYIDNNNLTHVERNWFTSFHERWENSNKEKHGELYLHTNPYICDCTMIDFIQWQRSHEWFQDQYSEKGYVSMGHCYYPENLKDVHFSEADEEIFECSTPRIIDHSKKAILTNKGEEEAIWITVVGMPAPVVTFNITTKDGTIVSREEFEHAPEFSDVAHHENEGPAIKHTLGFKTSAKAVIVTAEISGYNQLGEPFTLNPEAFTVVVVHSSAMKTFLIIMMLAMIGVILYKYKDPILDFIAVAMGRIKATNYSHQNYNFVPSEADNAALVSNEQTFDPNEPAELRINV